MRGRRNHHAPITDPARLGSTSSSSRSKGKSLMKDLADHLLHSTTVQADKTITTLLPGAIAKEVAGQLGTALSKAVQAEVHKQVADAIAPERFQNESARHDSRGIEASYRGTAGQCRGDDSPGRHRHRARTGRASGRNYDSASSRTAASRSTCRMPAGSPG